MKKTLLILLAVVLVLVVLIGVGLGVYLGPIVKIGMEQLGPKVAQVTVKVDGVDVALLSGSAALKGLVVGNPQGFATPQAISVGTVAISLDPLSVTSNKILIHSVHVVSPEITFEGGISRNNLSKILDNVTAFSKNVTPASGNSSTQSGNKLAPKIEVDDFLITGAKVHINITGVVSKDVSLPDIHLTDLGKENNGLTPSELTSAVLKAISSDTVSTVTSTIANLGQGVKGLGQNAAKTVGENVSKITSSFGGLFGK